ncbi:hypothetical protein D3C81_1717100 [compost metagenome]
MARLIGTGATPAPITDFGITYENHRFRRRPRWHAALGLAGRRFVFCGGTGQPGHRPDLADRITTAAVRHGVFAAAVAQRRYRHDRPRIARALRTRFAAGAVFRFAVRGAALYLGGQHRNPVYARAIADPVFRSRADA